MKLDVIYITCRHNPEFQWFTESLRLQARRVDEIRIICVDLFAGSRAIPKPTWCKFIWTEGKPTIWQGRHRITSTDWWAASNARNTGLCYAEAPTVAFLDDRCVLIPGWLDAVRRSQDDNYVLAGAYEKRVGMTVVEGRVIHPGTILGDDYREFDVTANGKAIPHDCPGCWMFGANLAMPLEWALSVNGYPEDVCDGMSFEDCIFGDCIQNAGYPIKYDNRCKIVEERTSLQCGPVMKRDDPGTSPDDKSHAALKKMKGLKVSMNSYDIREARNKLLSGGGFPPCTIPHKDWYNGRDIAGL